MSQPTIQRCWSSGIGSGPDRRGVRGRVKVWCGERRKGWGGSKLKGCTSSVGVKKCIYCVVLVLLFSSPSSRASRFALLVWGWGGLLRARAAFCPPLPCSPFRSCGFGGERNFGKVLSCVFPSPGPFSSLFLSSSSSSSSPPPSVVSLASSSSPLLASLLLRPGGFLAVLLAAGRIFWVGIIALGPPIAHQR